jgi:hypothetical protein
MSDDGPRPWVWAAWGCGGCLLLSGLVLVVLVLAGIRTVKNIDQEMNDPVARADKARELLGAEALPEGYHPVLTFSIPFLFDTVVLADVPLEGDRKFSDEAQRLFVYVEMIRGDREWRRYVEGGDPSDVLREQGIRMRRAEEIGRGELMIENQPIEYVSQRGGIEIHDEEFEGISTFLFIRCPGSKRMRIGVWTTPDPNEGIPVSEADFSGTNADPEQIGAFVSQFAFCGS